MEDERGRKKVAMVVVLLLLIVGIAAAVWYASESHRVTVEIEGEGTADPMEADVRHNGSLTITFTPDAGWRLASVTVDGSPADVDSVLRLDGIGEDRHVKAVFERIPGMYVLETSSNPGGSVEPSGKTAHALGDKVMVVITPDEGKVIDDVKLDGRSLGSINIVDVVMDSDHVIEVAFRDSVEGDVTVTIDVDVKVETVGADYGRIVPSGKVIVPYGGSITVDIELNSGYELESIAVDGKSWEPADRFTISDITDSIGIDIVLIHFSGEHVVTITSEGHGKVTPSGTVTVGHGQDLVMTFLPDSGYRLSVLEIDGKSVGTGFGTYTLKDIKSDHAVRAVFSSIPSPGPGPTPVAGDFEAIVDRITGTKVENGSIIGMNEAVEAQVKDGIPFELGNMIPGVHQTADMTLKNERNEQISVVLKLTSLSGNQGFEELAKQIQIHVKIGQTDVTQSLSDLISSETWSSSILVMAAGSQSTFNLTVSLPEDADSSAMGKSLSFKLTLEAYSG